MGTWEEFVPSLTTDTNRWCELSDSCCSWSSHNLAGSVRAFELPPEIAPAEVVDDEDFKFDRLSLRPEAFELPSSNATDEAVNTEVLKFVRLNLWPEVPPCLRRSQGHARLTKQRHAHFGLGASTLKSALPAINSEQESCFFSLREPTTSNEDAPNEVAWVFPGWEDHPPVTSPLGFATLSSHCDPVGYSSKHRKPVSRVMSFLIELSVALAIAYAMYHLKKKEAHQA